MGLPRITPLQTSDIVETVSLYDTAIDKGASDMDRFADDRSAMDAVVLKAPPPDEPWEAATLFFAKPLGETARDWVRRMAVRDAAALGDPEGAITGALLRWCFRLGCVGWEGAWRMPGPSECRCEGECPGPKKCKGPQVDPVPLEHEATQASGFQVIPASVMDHWDSLVVRDIGSVIGDLSFATEQEGKACGSPRATRANSTSTEKTAGPGPASDASGTSEDATAPPSGPETGSAPTSSAGESSTAAPCSSSETPGSKQSSDSDGGGT